MRNFFLGAGSNIFVLGILCFTLVISASYLPAEDHTTLLNGTMFKIDTAGDLWRQKGTLWLEVRRGGIFKNTERISASQSDNQLIVLSGNWLHAVNPDTGAYVAITRGITYEPQKMPGLCGLNKHAYLIYDDTLMRVRLDGTGGLEPIAANMRWVNTEGMASNQNSMVIVQGGVLHRLFEDGTYSELTKGVMWTGATSIFPASDGNYVITQRGQLHLVSDVDGKGAYKLVQP